MSASNFQVVMADILKFPTRALEVMHSQTLDLTADEFKKLHAMAKDPMVIKFGRDMRLCRKRDVTQAMTLSRPYIPSSLLDTLYLDLFEPKRTGSDYSALGVQFLEFLLKDGTCIDSLKGCPSFVLDLIRYDWAKAKVLHIAYLREEEILPKSSVLVHRKFVLSKFEHDLPVFDREKRRNSACSGAPESKPMNLLFLASENPPFYRVFEIDESIYQFLKTQQQDTPDRLPLPIGYANLVQVGLCVKVQ